MPLALQAETIEVRTTQSSVELLSGGQCSSQDAKELPEAKLTFEEQMHFVELQAVFEELRERYHLGSEARVSFAVAKCTVSGRPFQSVTTSSSPACCASISITTSHYRVTFARKVVSTTHDEIRSWAAYHALCFAKRSTERTNNMTEAPFVQSEGCVSDLVGTAEHALFYLAYLAPAVTDAVEQADRLNDYIEVLEAEYKQLPTKRW